MGPDSTHSPNIRLILETPLRQFAPWLAMVLLVTWAGYPGVVCATPMAWLIALAVGLRIASQSPSPSRSQRLTEAALAGAFLGLLQGVLFFIILPRLGPIAEDEQAAALAISLGMLFVGMPVAAGLSVFTAWLVERRTDKV